ncbi:MAG TPA: serine--tRNA ligase [Mycobacteriales bacterium]|nr:serine--tRNA ligase [Mycobacteriales bacterium]
MIDPRLLRDDPDRVRVSQRTRGDDPALVDVALDAEARRRAAVTRADALRTEQKSLGKGVARAQGEERTELLATLGRLASEVKEAEAEEAEAEAAFTVAIRAIDNVVEEDTPAGGEDDFVTLREVGTIPSYDAWTPRDHLDLGTLHSAIDTERAAKVSGARFYYLTGIGALLELALINLAMAQATDAGFIPVIAPALVKPEAMEGTGFLGAHSGEIYHLEDDDLYLVGTSEVPLAAMHMNEILDVTDTPRRYAGFSSCFRREAGSYGKDTRGIIRVHWFDKVEMFSFCPPDQSSQEHLRLLAWEEEMLAKLELPYRVVDIAGGDLGSSAARKYDCEAWLPSQQRYLELTSTSNCTDYQARRLAVRHRDADGKPALLHTLNGTLVAIARTIVALLENHQRPDGSIHVPIALRPHLGGREVLLPA